MAARKTYISFPLIFLLSALVAAVNVEGEQTDTNPDEFLVKFGYLEPVPEGGQQNIAIRRRAIRNFQRFVGLRVTGRIDEATRRKMAAPRCGNIDTRPAQTRYGPGKYLYTGYKWGKNKLTWRILNTNDDMPKEAQRTAFSTAFKYWQDASALTFEERPAWGSDITIKFASGHHGDGNAFDGEGRTLAHAFYPTASPFSGQAHFDQDETWTSGADHDKVNLEIVAAHEFGHLLGLGHSSVPQALMAPYYTGYIPNFKLHQDDVNGVRAIYGKPGSGNDNPNKGADPGKGDGDGDGDGDNGDGDNGDGDGDGDKDDGGKGGVPDPCTMTFDAMLTANDREFFVLKGRYIWKLNIWTITSGYPVEANKIFPRLPNGITAAAQANTVTGKTNLFFKGRRIFRYHNNKYISRTYIDGTNKPTKPEVAFQSRDGKIYVLQGSKYWELNADTGRYVRGGGRLISTQWPGLPKRLDAAVVINGILHVVQKNRYWRYDEFGKRLLSSYPRKVAPAFMGPRCGGRYVPK